MILPSSTSGIKVAVLGSNSFSGQDFIDLLLDHPSCHVLGVSRSDELPLFRLKYREQKSQSRFCFVQADLNHDLKRLLSLLDEFRPQWIVNFAAQSEVAPSWDRPQDWFQTNCVALAEMINHLRRQTYLERYLHVSSPEVYGTCVGEVTEDSPVNPSTPYAASKASADMLLRTYHRQFGFPLLTVRATNVYGARQQLFKIIPRSAIYLRLGKMIELHGGGRAVKSYIHVRDVSRGELMILERGEVGRLYHLSPDEGVSVRNVVSMVCAAAGKAFEKHVSMVDERPGQDAVYVISSARARKELGWAPCVPLDAGIAEVVQWVDENIDRIRESNLDYVHKP